MRETRWRLESRRDDLKNRIAEERDTATPNQERIDDLLAELAEVEDSLEGIEEVRDYA